MKRPVSWHKECLVNQYRSAERRHMEALRELDAANQDMKHADEYHAQIELAEAKGKTAFDSERFGVKRVKAK